MTLRVALGLVVLAVAAAPFASADAPADALEDVALDLGLVALRSDWTGGDVPTVTASTGSTEIAAGAPTLTTVWYFTATPWTSGGASRDGAADERRTDDHRAHEHDAGAERASRPGGAAPRAPDSYCAPRPATGALPFQVLPRICVPVIADPAPLLPLVPEGVVPSGLPLTGAPATAAPAPGHEGASVAGAPVGAPVLALPAHAGPLLAVAGVAAIAAGSAAAAPTLAWDRLKRLVVAAALYTRLTRESILTHDTRDAIFAALKAKPGSAIADLAEEARVPRNTATHHLHMLEKQGLVSSIRQGRVRLYFPVGSPEERRSAGALAVLRHETTSAVARAIGASPGLDQGTLCSATGVAPSLAHWHVARLVESGLVTQVRDGRRVRYYPGEAYHRVMNDAVLGPGA